MKVYELMSKKAITVTPEATFAEVWQIIFKENIHGLPVIEEENYLVGIIAEEDILAKLYPSYEEVVDDFVRAANFEEMENKIGELKHLKAKDLMNKKVFTTTPDTPILKALSTMIIRRVRQLPVIDKENKLLGMISKGDVFDHLFESYFILPKLRPRRKKREKRK